MAVPDNFRSAEEKERFIQSTFSAIAARYDRINRIMTFSMDRRWRRRTAYFTGAPVGGSALDVCCGTGELSQALAERIGARGRVVGLDFNQDMLDIGREKQRQGLLANNIEFLQGNAMELPFPDNEFDTATIGFALRNVPDYRRVLREMMRVVRPGGAVVSLETGKPSMPLFKSLHGLYVDQLVPLIDKLSGDKKGPYAWLARSATAFLSQDALCRVFADIGLKDVVYHDLFGGVVAIHVGRKL